MQGIMGAMKTIPSKISSEISKLRDQGFRSYFITGSFSAKYKLDTSTIDYEMARELYDNTHDKYKLGAWASKPVINTTVGFMGVPSFIVEDEYAQEIIDEFMNENTSKAQQAHLSALRDGDCWIWLTREEDEESRILYPDKKDGARIMFNIIPPEKIFRIRRDPLTGKPIEYIFATAYDWIDEHDNPHSCTIYESIDKDKRTIRIDGNIPPGIEQGEKPHDWGFIPIVQLSNERESSAANGKSELESLEPFMKAYHDIMIHAIQGSKLHSTPRLKLKLKDVASFLQNNFGVTDPAEFVRSGKTISLDNKELLIFQHEDEDAEFIEVKSATGDAKVLLKLLFYCMVDVSETPEFAFGTHTPSSHASVKEQMPVLVRKIERKRTGFAESWNTLIRMVLAMQSKASGKKINLSGLEIEWEEIDPRDDKELAQTVETLVKGLVLAVNSELISYEAASEFLANYINTMNSYESNDPKVMGERDKILRDLVSKAGLEDREAMEREEELIKQALEARQGDD